MLDKLLLLFEQKSKRKNFYCGEQKKGNFNSWLHLEKEEYKVSASSVFLLAVYILCI